MKVLYTAKAEALGGRDGFFKVLNDGNLESKLTVPKGMGGPGGPGANPEQLFAAGYSACFAGAIKHVASKEKKAIEPPHVTGEVSFGVADDGGFQLAVKLSVAIPGTPKAQVQEIIEKAHQVCPYSRATRGNIEVKLEALEA